ncbi:hypothetical protein COLO4_23181 [Corchorus olitorius]|uniref:Uncharacterized protein n=1 Tax=Corchorus olitorius TaxID=93759 RepID=A0A1R3II08_9ROSI|nr:hypothetical protein COLO4_23181 [Corchorus olitorius]
MNHRLLGAAPNEQQRVQIKRRYNGVRKDRANEYEK